MRILVTAGNTQTPIDRVRCISNVFTGRTGTAIASQAVAGGHEVELLTSHPELAADLLPRAAVHVYRTFDDLHRRLEQSIRGSPPDAIVHCAAVADYFVAGVYAPDPASSFDPQSCSWNAKAQLVDVAREKVKSSHNEVWLRLVPTPKLVDLFRSPWGFAGVLVKFKLEVGVVEDELRAIADQSRIQSNADLIVANTLEGMADWALLGSTDGTWTRVDRPDLARSVMAEVERISRQRPTRDRRRRG